MNPERMDDATRAELLNAEIDGVATESQRAALAELLQRDLSAREELEALRAVAELLGRTPVPGAPESFAEGVMMAVRRVRTTSWLTRLRSALVRAGWSWGPQREDSVNYSHEHGYVSAGVGAPKRSREDVMARQQNMFQRRMIFAGAGVLAVAALVVYFGGYYPPAKEEAFGTIGQAERYRSSQITGADVKLENPELQAFLQSETFDRIVRDPAARQALSNADLQAAIVNDKFAANMTLARQWGGQMASLQREMADLNQRSANVLAQIRGGADANKLQGEMASLGQKLADMQSKLDKNAQAQAFTERVAQATHQALLVGSQLQQKADKATLSSSVSKLNDMISLVARSAEASVLAERGGAQSSVLTQKTNPRPMGQRDGGQANVLAERGGAQANSLAERSGAQANVLAQRGGVEANVLNARNAEAISLMAKSLLDAAGKLDKAIQMDNRAEAISLARTVSANAIDLGRTAASLQPTALDAAVMRTVFSAAQLDHNMTFAAGAQKLNASAAEFKAASAQLAKATLESQSSSLRDQANKLNQSASQLDARGAQMSPVRFTDQAIAMAAQRTLEANPLKGAIARLESRNAEALAMSAKDFSAVAASLDKQLIVLSNISKLDAIAKLDVRSWNAIGQLADRNMIAAAIQGREAAVQGRDQ